MATLNSAADTAVVEPRDSLVEALCAKARHLDVVLTLLNNANGLSMLDEDGRSDAQWLLADLAADAANMARQIEAASAA
ncbi:MAG: hypothetical protein JF607_21120 [Burkholderiales bacterium]|jgi:hypothetical protein|nr:hypothetical protein [Burkholderiales bacterium]